MRIKVIASGSRRWERLIRRWGLSLLIGDDLLFDTFGDPGYFLGNIRKFGIDLSKIKHIFLSHGHWDHISGLWHLINGRRDITVYICPGFSREIKDRINSFGVKLVEAADATLIKEGIYSSGELCGESGGRKIYEHSLIIKKEEGLSLICGCAHPGIENIVRHVKKDFRGDIYSLIGGFHLQDNTQGTNKRIVKELRILGIRRVAPMHCTGGSAAGIMRYVFGSSFVHLGEGQEIEL